MTRSTYCLVLISCYSMHFLPPSKSQETSSPNEIAAEIEKRNKAEAPTNVWEGTFSRQRGLRGESLYIGADRWASPQSAVPAAGVVTSGAGQLDLHVGTRPGSEPRSFLVVE